MSKRNYVVHPYKILLYLFLAAVTMLFVGFSLSYIYTRFDQQMPPVQLPWLFYINTIILIASSYTIIKTKEHFTEDRTEEYKRYLSYTLGLTLLFLISQIFAWKQMYDSDIFINYSVLSAYMYLVSAVHFAHVIMGIPFLVYFTIQAYKRLTTPMESLLYFSDDHKKMKIELFTIYWHFLDGLWIYLVVFLLINYLIK